MKVLKVTILSLVVVSSFAKMTVFSSAEALRLSVSEEVLSKILTKTKTSDVLKVEVEKLTLNQFRVSLESTDGSKICDSEVLVKDKKVKAQIPGGAVITTNKLEVSNILLKNCK